VLIILSNIESTSIQVSDLALWSTQTIPLFAILTFLFIMFLVLDIFIHNIRALLNCYLPHTKALGTVISKRLY